MAQKGTSLTYFGSVFRTSEPWLIDSGATDHMIGCEKLFSSYIPSSSNHRVKFDDGSYSLVAGIRTITINPEISLQSVLHVPKLSCNLISISKITKEFGCMVNFHLLLVFFKTRLRKG